MIRQSQISTIALYASRLIYVLVTPYCPHQRVGRRAVLIQGDLSVGSDSL